MDNKTNTREPCCKVAVAKADCSEVGSGSDHRAASETNGVRNCEQGCRCAGVSCQSCRAVLLAR